MTSKMGINNLRESLLNKKNIVQIVLSAIILILFLTSLIIFLCKDTKRRTFIFPSVTEGKYIVEYRNLSKKAAQGQVNLFVDEILLGSQIERTQKLFVSGTKVLSCFQRGKVLYLNLSDDLIKVDDSVVDIKSGVDLLEKNIKKNFPNIETVEVFINGKIAFEK